MNFGRVCPVCGAIVNGQRSTKRYCSRDCRRKALNLRRRKLPLTPEIIREKEATVPVACAVCGKEFLVPYRRGRKAKCCSPECRAVRNKELCRENGILYRQKKRQERLAEAAEEENPAVSTDFDREARKLLITYGDLQRARMYGRVSAKGRWLRYDPHTRCYWFEDKTPHVQKENQYHTDRQE